MTKMRETPKRSQADITTLVHIDNPDDAEFAEPLAPGDPESLVRLDNPDDALRPVAPAAADGGLVQRERRRRRRGLKPF